MGTEEAALIDSSGGAWCVATILKFHGLAADFKNTRHVIGSQPTESEIVRYLREQGLKAKRTLISVDRLYNIAVPAVVRKANGQFIVLAKVSDDRVLISDPTAEGPSIQPRSEFEANWNGEVILATRRASLSELGRRFDVTWFLGAVQKYRWILGEVLLASLFLQLFGLISPLFFQVVVDKVLVHRGTSTLDVLVFGLITIGVFEALIGGIRTYAFGHTTNRIDVELGARLFRHLLALPLPYFQARRVGDSVARVRELENIRQFLTGSALTLVIDLLFTVVFLAVMAAYSLTLTAVVLATLPIYIAVSVIATPLFRNRLAEKFKRGAENQSFLVEAGVGSGYV